MSIQNLVRYVGCVNTSNVSFVACALVIRDNIDRDESQSYKEGVVSKEATNW